jgi:peptide-methionine (S)-S-oxide reductase
MTDTKRPPIISLPRVFLAAALFLTLASRALAETATVIPEPALAGAAASSSGTEKIVLAGGCFWGVQAVFQHVNGVVSAVSGYAGGARETASYRIVSTGRTGHAESVEVTFDPRVVSYGRILQIFFSVVHDPTQLNRQGPDIGTQYRSEIFTLDDRQARIAKDYIAQLERAGVFKRPIVTVVAPLEGFYPAERHHQDYATLHPDAAYIVYNDAPKVENLARLFPELYRSKARLVSGADR